MKKVVLVILALYVAIVVGLLLLDRPEADRVRIMAVERPLSLLVCDPEETIPVWLWIDDPDAFPTAVDNVAAASLTDGEDELALGIAGIAATGGERVREGVRYHEFRFDFVADGIAIEAAELVFAPATLHLEYRGGISGNYRIGDVELVFGEPGEPRHLDFMRLSATFSSNDGLEGISGLSIALRSLTGTAITVTSVRLHCPGIEASTGEAIAFDPDRMDVDPDPRPLVGIPREGSFDVYDETWLIPIVHADRIRPATRFLIDIRYTYAENEYRLLIDDFAFRTAFSDPIAYGEDVHVYEHLR
ncbi:MAG: hypothetical protein WC509_03100 [Candidatus Izemoplasmatales bacterium]